uniref:ATP synthase subunit a n=1 Tax=Centrorhynchus milvus TaxID=2594319 RepID=A0A515KYY2_9BILA|nr:ATP synthase F0 subunit 6 [Centrorhynchus milvus]
MGFISSCIVLLGVGVVWRGVSGESLRVLGNPAELGVWASLTCLGVMGLWVMDNLAGLFLGTSVSVGYGVVLLFGVSLWAWGELEKSADGGLVGYCSHYSVQGLQGMLVLFLPFMELLSILIRPLTLSVRLSTNITSGHVLLTMVSILGAGGFVWGSLVLSGGWLLGLLEVFVGVLQGGIFSLLVGIYME